MWWFDSATTPLVGREIVGAHYACRVDAVHVVDVLALVGDVCDHARLKSSHAALKGAKVESDAVRSTYFASDACTRGD